RSPLRKKASQVSRIVAGREGEIAECVSYGPRKRRLSSKRGYITQRRSEGNRSCDVVRREVRRARAIRASGKRGPGVDVGRVGFGRRRNKSYAKQNGGNPQKMAIGFHHSLSGRIVGNLYRHRQFRDQSVSQ